MLSHHFPSPEPRYWPLLGRRILLRPLHYRQHCHSEFCYHRPAILTTLARADHPSPCRPPRPYASCHPQTQFTPLTCSDRPSFPKASLYIYKHHPPPASFFPSIPHHVDSRQWRSCPSPEQAARPSRPASGAESFAAAHTPEPPWLRSFYTTRPPSRRHWRLWICRPQVRGQGEADGGRHGWH